MKAIFWRDNFFTTVKSWTYQLYQKNNIELLKSPEELIKREPFPSKVFRV